MGDLLRQQIEYYRARASEYDEWFLRQGRYDRGAALNARWFEEAARVRAALEQFAPGGAVLELACGTGLWTEALLAHADRITAVDAAAEVLELNRRRCRSPRVEYLQADLFNWQPPAQYDAVFFSFWLSHVPEERFESFWGMAARALNPGGRVFFIDSKYDQTSTARDHHLGPPETGTATRRLNDGREFEIVKIFYRGEELERRLGRLGWRVQVRETAHYFLYGLGGPA